MSILPYKQSKVLWTFEFILLLMLVSVGNTSSDESEMFSIQNKTHITCATDDEDSPIFLDPPSMSKLQNIYIYPSGLENTGWKLTNSEELFYQPVTDKRWEEFQTNFTNFTCRTMKKYVTFSVFNLANQIELFLDDDDTMSMVEISISERKTPIWVDFHIKTENENVFVYANNELVHSATHFTPTKFCFRTNKETTVKFHDYKIWYSDTVSTEPTEVSVPNGCLLLYVSVCEDCFLRIEKDGHTDETISYEKDWQEKKIELDPRKQFVHLIKTKTKVDAKGHWAIDVRQCPRKINNKVIYETMEKSNEAKQQCYTLNHEQKSNGKPNWHCKVGHLGKQCDVTCEQLLGKKGKYCQKQLVCENDECKCAWGFQGEFCEKLCDHGYWGFDCRRKCSEKNCESCDPITGKCFFKESTSTNESRSDPQNSPDNTHPSPKTNSTSKKVPTGNVGYTALIGIVIPALTGIVIPAIGLILMVLGVIALTITLYHIQKNNRQQQATETHTQNENAILIQTMSTENSCA